MSGKSAEKDPTQIVEVEFVFRDSTFPFVSITENEECRIDLVEMIPRHGRRYAEYFRIAGINPRKVIRAAEAHGSIDVSLLQEFEGGGLFEFVVSDNCPAWTLAELGALPREATAVGGEGRIVAEIPPKTDPKSIITNFLNEASDAELVAKREKESFTGLFADSAFSQILYDELTERQREVLKTAFEMGYYEWPRGSSGKEIAAELGISSSTFSEHIHAAERKLLSEIFENAGF